MKDLFLFGNTPTCVGKTIILPTESWTLRKHPHVRGEDWAAREGYVPVNRNTPTCVGKTFQK